MCIDVRCQLDRGVPHEVLSRSDVDALLAQIGTVSVPETVRYEVISKR